MKVFAGSFMKTRNGVGAERSATPTMLASSSTPSTFHPITRLRDRRPVASHAPSTSAVTPLTMSKFRPA
jgi:hypothetical protein